MFQFLFNKGQWVVEEMKALFESFEEFVFDHYEELKEHQKDMTMVKNR